MRDRLDRRGFVKAVGGTVVGTALVADSAAAGDDELSRELQRVRKATRKYRNLGAALRDGYKPFGPSVSGMGWHFINNRRVGGAIKHGFDITKPQLLVYAPTPDGKLNLAGVEYGIPVGLRGYDGDNPPDLFSDEGANRNLRTSEHHGWHVHHAATHAFADGDGRVDHPDGLGDLLTASNWAELRPPRPDLGAGDELTADWHHHGHEDTRVVDFAVTHPDLWTLHAWVHRGNPEGVFHPTNPHVRGALGHDH